MPGNRARNKLLREQQLLQLAQNILQQDGFAGLTMDRLTAASEVSKGTIYNHFCSKEDLITALSVDSLQRQLLLFHQVLALPGHSRERALALHYAYYRFSTAEPTLFLCLLSATTAAVVEKTSATRLAQRQALEQQLLSCCEQVINQAIADKALQLQAGRGIDQLTYLQWALAFGANALYGPSQQMGFFQGLEQQQLMLAGINLLLDGLDWTPLSGQFDYQQSWRRIAAALPQTQAAQ
ncbi:TetR/AcrR family transcriptional regulator [Rheinheimera sp.]|uniref:TetR/AcrR family transcriptional regulator n=1 Tax=Rheinheimera sp. TaxID=1869214 RepID=UPI0027B99C1B|nr:TetR/AcrR family transcriptional regulator [Rheinheimera sp.]